VSATGIVVDNALTRVCEEIAVDGDGRLLVECGRNQTSDGSEGDAVYRSY
jgi:hypothetical protein